MEYDWLESEIMTATNNLENFDLSVFFNPMFKSTSFGGFLIEKELNYIRINYIVERKEIETVNLEPSCYGMFNNSSYNESWLRDYEQKHQHRVIFTKYNISFSFQDNLLIGLEVQRNSKKLLTVIIGNDKILVDENKWYDKATFEEVSFQQSLIEKRTNFDILYISSVLKKFKLA